MSLTVYKELEQRSPEWFEARAGIVTASTVGRLITVSTPGPEHYECPECAAPQSEPCISLRGGTPIKTMHSGRADVARFYAHEASPVLAVADNDTSQTLTITLAAERVTGHVEETPINADMWRGIEEEPHARDAYTEHTGAHVEEVGFMVRDFGGYRIGYSPDGLVGDDGLIEIKSRRSKKHVLTVLADEVPAENMAQIQCGLLVSGRKWCDYISYSGGMALWVKRVYPDPEWHAAILTAAQTFEANAAEIVAAYTAATEGLPITERLTDYEDITI